MGGVSAQPSYLKRVSLNDGTSHSQLLVGTINAVYYVGVVVGAIIIASVSDRIGRRKACVCSGLVGIVAVGVVCSLQNFSWALWARFFNGLATGSFDAVGLNWTAETAKSKRRGLAFGLLMSCAAFGASKSYFIIFGLSRHMTGEFVWRFTLAFQAVYMLIILVAAFLLPESPRWLVLAGHYEEARSVLTDLSGPGGLSEAEHQAAIDGELSAIHSALEEERAHSASTSYLQMLFTNDHYSTARRTWTALFVQFACQLMIGAGLVATYGISIFQAGGWSAETASLLAGVSIITQAVFGLPGALLADVVGRRPAMIGGALLSSIILAFIGMCGHFVDANARAEQQDISKTRTYASATVALVLLWSAQFGMNWCESHSFYRLLISKPRRN
jgi:MFS family permease